jgi:hypothetical protein
MKTSPLVVPPQSREKSTSVRCGGCGAEFNEETWLELALVQRVTPDDIRRFLIRWPEGASLEIRQCRHCGTNIATKEQA